MKEVKMVSFKWWFEKNQPTWAIAVWTTTDWKHFISKETEKAIQMTHINQRNNKEITYWVPKSVIEEII